MLADLLLEEGYNLDDAKEGYEGYEGLYLERRGGGHAVVLEDCDQLGAMWEGIEAALVEAGFAFDRFSNGYAGSWSDSIAAWRPGLPKVYEAVADANQQHAYICLDEIRLPCLAQRHPPGHPAAGADHLASRGGRRGDPQCLTWSCRSSPSTRPRRRTADRRGEGLHRCASTA